MKKKLVTLILVLFATIPLFAQTNNASSYSIKGQVIDSLSNESVPYATLNIVLANAPQQSVKRLACDIDGKFETTLNAPGNYVVTMQSIGKVPAQKSFTLSESNKNVNLGKLFMSDDTQRLGEVTVSAQKPLVKVDIDKISYSLEDDPEAITNNTLEMLRKVPMVTVDGEDKIQLKGSSNFVIHLNGKPSNLLSNNPSDVLKSMPASSIKNIEVITEPGAKYDAEGIGGIINIITKTNSLQGFSGSVRGSANSVGYWGGGAYLTSKIGKVGLTGNYNYSQRNSPWTSSETYRESLSLTEPSYLNQTGRVKNKGPYQHGNVEISYEIDTLNLLSIGGTIYQGSTKRISELAVNKEDVAHNSVYDYDRHSNTKNTYGSKGFNLDYQRSTRKKEELITFSYRFNENPNDSESYTDLLNVNNYVDPHGYTYPQKNVNDASTREHTAQIDYTTPFKKGHTFEVGAKYIMRQSKSETDRTMLENGAWVNIPEPNNHFKHTQHIYSAYTGYALRISKYGAKAGVRAEGTSLNVKYKNGPDLNFDTDYFDIVPNATLSYQVDMSKQMRIGYNMRIHRPGIWYLNPYVNNTDPADISYGNPNLDSEKSHNINLNFSSFTQKFNLNASANYSFVNNSIQRYTFVDPETPNVTQSTYGNIGKRQQIGGYLYASWTPNMKFNIYVNGGVNYTDLESDEMGISKNDFTGHGFAGARYSLPHDIRLNLNGGYFGPWIQLQSKSSAQYFMSFSVNKDFLKKKLTVSLSANSPFWKSMKYTNTTKDPSFNLKETNHWRMRSFGINITYKFGSMKEQIKKVRRGINNDDEKGEGSGGGAQGGGSPQ